MQGKSAYSFPNNLLVGALANILCRANPNIISPIIFWLARLPACQAYYFPLISRLRGFFGFYIKNPSLGWGNFISIFHAFYFQRKR